MGYGSIFAGDEHYPFEMFFPTTPNLSVATDGIRSPKTMSSKTCFIGKVKFNSSLNGSPTSSG